VPALAMLRAACGAENVRVAGPEDAIDRVKPLYVASPGSTEQTAAVLRVAAANGLPVVPRGAGTKLDWGMPPRSVGVVVEMTRMAVLLEHAAGDLIVRAQAGLALASLQEALAARKQRLSLDPMRPGATLGGIIATGSSGPLRLLYGTARDLLIGVTVVRADGAVARSGGRVVKNVAGYDLGKLYNGSFGTLGIVTEAIFRLHPVPQAQAWVSATVSDATDAAPLLAAVLSSQLVASGLEVDQPAPQAPVTVTALLEGSTAGVSARAAACARLLGGTAASHAPQWWGRYPFSAQDTALKLTCPVSAAAGLLAAASRAAADYGIAQAARGSAAGSLYIAIPAAAPAQSVASYVTHMRSCSAQEEGALVVLRAPDSVRSLVDSWGQVAGLDLMRRVKAQFDPQRLLSPGRFVGGI
jgi:glycolate oxidase FAD binding subunit